jgi:ribosome-binding ATPase YchF (GTP1/OBG family)
MDVAGLVPGASEGKGLGNQFLDDLRQADVFIHIVDASGTTDETGKILAEGKTHDPCKDINFLEEELDIWFFNIMIKVWKGFARQTEIEKGGGEGKNFAKAVTKQFSGLKVNEEDVKQVLRELDFAQKVKPSQWTDKMVKEFARRLRQLSKPMVIAANKCDHPNAKKNIETMQENFPDYLIYACSADGELALREAAKHGLIEYIPGEKSFKINESKINLKQKEALEKIKKNVLDVYDGTGVQEILNHAVFELLKYMAIFPAGAHKLADSDGNILPDCFLLPPNSTALDFAFYLHTDFGKNFIKAIDARSKRALGKDYQLKHRDALEIVTK